MYKTDIMDINSTTTPHGATNVEESNRKYKIDIEETSFNIDHVKSEPEEEVSDYEEMNQAEQYKAILKMENSIEESNESTDLHETELEIEEQNLISAVEHKTVLEENAIKSEEVKEPREIKIEFDGDSSEKVSGIGDTAVTTVKRRQRLGGGSRKRLRRLLKAGVPYETALAAVLEKRQVRVEETKLEKPAASTSAMAGKRQRSEEESFSEDHKKIKGTEAYMQVLEGVRVGILHSQYPARLLDNEQLVLVQNAVLRSVDSMPEEGSQVRFQSCFFRPGWLVITCVDQESCDWLVKTVNHLQPWNGASLKAVTGEDIPKPHICVVYIPDDIKGVPLTSETILRRLRKMNHGLRTQEWRVLHCGEAGPGHTWTFSMDGVSFRVLEECDFRPYFGYGQLVFRPKSSRREGQRSHALRGAEQGAQPSTSNAPFTL